MIERTFGGKVWYLSINEMVGFAGMVLGGLLLSAWGGFKNRNKTYTLGMLAFAALMFCVSFFIPMVQTASMTMLQEKTAPEMQGRVFSLLNVMFSDFMPMGMAATATEAESTTE